MFADMEEAYRCLLVWKIFMAEAEEGMVLLSFIRPLKKQGFFHLKLALHEF